MEDKAKFALGLENVKSIYFDKYAKNFTFIVNSKRYQTSRFLADLLSPTISKYHFIDESINEFTLTTIKTNGKPKNNNDYFLDFLSLSAFNEQEIDDDHKLQYLNYFLQLGNTDEYFRLQPEYSEKITTSNVVKRLRTIKSNKLSQIKFQDTYNKLIEYSAQNFESLSIDELKKLEIESLEEILSHKSLKLKDEDFLLELILDLYSSDNEYSSLFEYIQFCNVSENALEEFVNEFDIELMNIKIWEKICQRLLLPSKQFRGKNIKNTSCQKMTKVISIDHKEGDEFNGLLRYLTDETGENIHDNETVNITSNSINTDNVKPRNLVDYSNIDTCNYCSKRDTINAYVCFDFKNRKIQLSSYSLKSFKYDPNYFHLKNWVIETSNDGYHWKIIDQHINDPSLNAYKVTRTFNIRQSTEFSRFVRLRQTCKNWHDDYYIVLYSIEFYGKLENPE